MSEKKKLMVVLLNNSSHLVANEDVLVEEVRRHLDDLVHKLSELAKIMPCTWLFEAKEAEEQALIEIIVYSDHILANHIRTYNFREVQVARGRTTQESDREIIYSERYPFGLLLPDLGRFECVRHLIQPFWVVGARAYAKLVQAQIDEMS